MAAKFASSENIARGRRLEKWLERVAPDIPKSYRGEIVLETPRQTVYNWILGSDIGNEGIRKIVQVGGYETLSYILGVKPLTSAAKIKSITAGARIHGKGVRFWYQQYIREKMKTVLDEKQEYEAIPEPAREALKAATDFARIRASEQRSLGSKKPRAKGYEFAEE
ncbi:MAG: hypothetical protein LIP23_07240 [Planctomycetes bacterium]|nr:hypothetical protein [Planctomycetota bacterium]